jgi:hypothetical protein
MHQVLNYESSSSCKFPTHQDFRYADEKTTRSIDTTESYGDSELKAMPHSCAPGEDY